MTLELGRLERVPVREVWPHEAKDFTPWLALPANLSLLSNTLNLGDLGEIRTEVSVINFYIDILAKDGLGGLVLIENQFGSTDHRHLGQIMTYLAGQEGRVTIVWIAETFGEAHRAAVDWLNMNTTDSFNFFAVQFEAWKIGASLPAPGFNVIAKPNSWTRLVTEVTKAENEQHSRYAAYWVAFGNFLAQQGAPFAIGEAPPISWSYRFPIGVSGASLLASAAIGNNRVAVEVNLTNKMRSKSYFDGLLADRSAIEAQVGQQLEWLRQDEYILSRIAAATRAFNVSDKEQWSAQFAWLLEYLLKFKAAFSDRLKSLSQPIASPNSEPDDFPN